jgi:hypothetical protein
MRTKIGILAVLATMFTTVFAGTASAREHVRDRDRESGYSRYMEGARAERLEREHRIERARERHEGRRGCW